MWDGRNIVARMGSELGTLDGSIRRVTLYWEDRVSEKMQTGCINELAQESVNAVNEFDTLCANIEGILDDMRFRVYR